MKVLWMLFLMVAIYGCSECPACPISQDCLVHECSACVCSGDGLPQPPPRCLECPVCNDTIT